VALKVVGAGVGRTGTNSLKVALEQLLGGKCHHMHEMMANPDEVPAWVDAIDGKPTDWVAMMSGYVAQVDWPGASFWPELSEANPDALVVLSVRSAQSWYASASATIFQVFDRVPPELQPWFEKMRELLGARFSADMDNPTAMMEAFEKHNQAVRDTVPASRLLEWTAADGWEPLCGRLGLPVPIEPFPLTNTKDEFFANLDKAPAGPDVATNTG
jgi:Sulfotransferase domain